jgi:hypothetical protein
MLRAALRYALAAIAAAWLAAPARAAGDTAPAPASPARAQSRPAPPARPQTRPAPPAGAPGRPVPATRSSTEASRALRDEQAELEKFLAALAEHSEKYRLSMLRFVCEETLIRSEFDAGSGRRHKEEVDKYDYLFSRNRAGEVVETRRPLGSAPGAAWKEMGLGLPEPYLWTLLFSPHNQKLFNYRLAGQEVVHFQLSTVIDFNALLPFVDGATIPQWSGRAYIDAHSLDLLRIEAEPSGQQIRLEAAAQAYRQKFRLGGVPLGRRPRAHLHEVDFTYEHEGLRLPGLAITRHYFATDPEQPSLKTQFMQIFSDYHVFSVETDEQMKAVSGSGTP